MMNIQAAGGTPAQRAARTFTDTGLIAVAMVAAYYRIAVDPVQLQHEMALKAADANAEDLVRAARRIGLKARLLTAARPDRLVSIPLPAVVGLKGGGFAILSAGP